MIYEYFKHLTRTTASDKILHLILLKIRSMVDIEGVLLQWFINFLIKRLLLRVQLNLLVVVLKMRIFQTKNKLKNKTNQLLENVRKEKFTHFL